MQHGPSLYTIIIFFLLLLGMVCLGSRILPKWHPLYAKKKVRYGYWLVTAISIAIFILNRWLRTAGDSYGEWFRYLIYGAYVWTIGLLFMLIVLLIGHAVRLLLKKPDGPPDSRTGASGGKRDVPAAAAITRRQFLQGAIAAVPAMPLAMSTYGVLGGDYNIVLNRYTLPFAQLPPALDGFTIAQISDTHIGSFFSIDKLDRVLAMVRREKPDMLAITGDLVDDLALLSPMMERLTAFQRELPQGIFYCWGNHEYFRDIGRIRRAVEASPVTLLSNCSQQVKAGLYLAGVDYPWGKNRAEQAERRRQYFAKAVHKIPAGAFTVLLTHHPDFFDNAFAAGVPLSLAGHTHGGQVSIRGVSLLPLQYKYMRGLYSQEGCCGYVSVGTGHWFPLRIGCPAEVSLFTLKRG